MWKLLSRSEATQTDTEKVPRSESTQMDTVAKPETQPSTIIVGLVIKKKQRKWRSTSLVREEGASPQREQEEESEEASCSAAGQPQEQEREETEIINEVESTRSLSLSKLRDMRKDYGRQPGEQIATWLLRCWDTGASRLELEGKEAQQLGSLSRERGIDKGIGRGQPSTASGGKVSPKEELVNYRGKWTTAEEGVQYLRELAVVEVIYSDLDNNQASKDPDEVQCMRSMWRTFPASQLWIGPANSSDSKRIWRISSSLPLQARVSVIKSAVRSRPFPAQRKGNHWRTPCSTLWFHLRNHGEDMRKWVGAPTSDLEAHVRELGEKTMVKKGPSRKITAPVAVEQFPRCSRRAEDASPPSDSDPMDLSVSEAGVSLTGNKWQKHPNVTGPEALGYFKNPKGYRWAFGVATVDAEKIKQLSTLPGLSEDVVV
ncbi:hypothetical protein QYF61_027341 [Mycteria americana]|uniref:Uncharacterized protein n=1 Tax=Mycteria americana TaxID=33587 RepID=A0AAN7RHG8_MYCAM|nr:hypothetical protein QYF61_027341 [Mycteria americana]